MNSLLCKAPVATPFTSARSQSRSVRRTVVRAVAEAEPVVEKKERKLGPLERGGTLSGELAAGKDAGDAAKAALVGSAVQGTFLKIVDGKFRDDRWENGRWILSHPAFKKANGETDWDLVIDAEVARRKLLEDYPIPSINEEAVVFDTAEIPWWAWVKRFHLPEAEKLNGRAAMLGYVLAGVVDLLSGAGLVEQQESFFGKLLLHICVFGVLLVRENKDFDNLKNLFDEATFYDKQWQASWEGIKKPSETQQ